MNGERNIFFNLVKDENSFTELLCNFLTIIPLFKQIFFHDFLKLDLHALPATDEIVTQRRLADKGQPDMYIGREDIEILIEIKINNTFLTDSQPEKYLTHIQQSEKKYKKLIFIIPERYSHQADLRSRAVNFCILQNLVCEQYLSIHNWNELIQLIHHYELDQLNPLFKHFQSLLKSWFEPPFISLKHTQIQYMFNHEIPSVLLKLYQVIDAIFSEYNRRGYLISKAKNGNEYGLYLKDSQGKPLIYIGIWYIIWQKTGSPICLAVSTSEHSIDIRSKFTKFIQDQSYQPIKEGVWECITLSKDKFNSNQNLLVVVTEELNKALSYLETTS
ncbi:PD-(D/E)XK nuclease family protein [Cytophagaceae bacterium DM2B3-1]|uniref:PD-(D/E)XK nuclease family protein n=1 Tax=Xanthocytophaga flava TaxID=3048013 RepID=A0ABT7CIW9_9BACT|nr:PD-(D/E)XK nuclease family protein [Xanthocytophaga flavus]MDJ1493682.1 PD-(D/E)XK nuclease family protein [Xanthocytophaga flavus]